MFFHGVHLLQDNSRSSKASLDKRFPATSLVKTAAYGLPCSHLTAPALCQPITGRFCPFCCQFFLTVLMDKYYQPHIGPEARQAVTAAMPRLRIFSQHATSHDFIFLLVPKKIFNTLPYAAQLAWLAAAGIPCTHPRYHTTKKQGPLIMPSPKGRARQAGLYSLKTRLQRYLLMLGGRCLLCFFSL